MLVIVCALTRSFVYALASSSQLKGVRANLRRLSDSRADIVSGAKLCKSRASLVYMSRRATATAADELVRIVLGFLIYAWAIEVAP